MFNDHAVCVCVCVGHVELTTTSEHNKTHTEALYTAKLQKTKILNKMLKSNRAIQLHDTETCKPSCIYIIIHTVK